MKTRFTAIFAALLGLSVFGVMGAVSGYPFNPTFGSVIADAVTIDGHGAHHDGNVIVGRVESDGTTCNVSANEAGITATRSTTPLRCTLSVPGSGGGSVLLVSSESQAVVCGKDSAEFRVKCRNWVSNIEVEAEFSFVLLKK